MCFDVPEYVQDLLNVGMPMFTPLFLQISCAVVGFFVWLSAVAYASLLESCWFLGLTPYLNSDNTQSGAFTISLTCKLGGGLGDAEEAPPRPARVAGVPPAPPAPAAPAVPPPPPFDEDGEGVHVPYGRGGRGRGPGLQQFELPGLAGDLRLDDSDSKNTLVAHCKCGHGSCRMERTFNIKRNQLASGRPIGTLVAWLRRAEDCANRKEHKDMQVALTRVERRAARAWALTLPHLAPLFERERPPREDEGSEPGDIP
jgi:hypothetical protein